MGPNIVTKTMSMITEGHLISKIISTEFNIINITIWEVILQKVLP